MACVGIPREARPMGGNAATHLCIIVGRCPTIDFRAPLRIGCGGVVNLRGDRGLRLRVCRGGKCALGLIQQQVSAPFGPRNAFLHLGELEKRL